MGISHSAADFLIYWQVLTEKRITLVSQSVGFSPFFSPKNSKTVFLSFFPKENAPKKI
jgi:hypothetical protein